MVGGVPLASFVVGTEKGRCTRDLMLTLSVNESADLALEDWAATYTEFVPRLAASGHSGALSGFIRCWML